MKAIVCKYHGPTNFKSSRISATAEGVGRIYRPFDYDASDEDLYRNVAIELCNKYGWRGADSLIEGGLPNGDRVFVFGPDRFKRDGE